MNSLAKIIQRQNVLAEQVDWQKLDPSFRRATRNMTLATLACQKTLIEWGQTVPHDQISLVVGTHFGEVESTLDFLSGPIPSPTLFQNSLHNSTLGFVSVSLGLTGPGMTVSCDKNTVEAAFEAAESLLQLTPYSLVCLVDSVPEKFRSLYLQVHPFAADRIERASCALISRSTC